jgi:hypothetical protein
MPASQTITGFNVFVPASMIRSAQMNANFSVFRGHLIPINTDAATSSDLTHDLGAPTHRWNNIYGGVAVLTGQSTPAANPTTGQYKVYMKSDGILYRLNAAGAESPVTSGVPLTTKGDVAVHDGSATIRFPVGTNGQVLMADSSATAGVKWAAAGSKVIANATATYSVANSTDLVILSGSSFTATLFSCTGNDGEEVELLHDGTNFTNVYQIRTSGTDVIATMAGDTTTISMYTKGERFKLLVSGGKFKIVEHKAETAWTDGGANTFTATTSAPGKGTTAVDKFWYKRVGDTLMGRVEFRQTVAGTAGTGDYLLAINSMLSGVTIDTGKVTVYTVAEGSGAWETNNAVGHCNYGSNSVINIGIVVVYNANSLAFMGIASDNASNNTLNAFGSTTYPLSTASQRLVAHFAVPITGWQP